jgi:hypothetical protein
MLYLPTPVDGVCYDCDPTDPCAAAGSATHCEEHLGCDTGDLSPTYTMTYDGNEYTMVWWDDSWLVCEWYGPDSSVMNWNVRGRKWIAMPPGISSIWNGPTTPCDPTGEYTRAGYPSIWIS